MRNSIKTVFAAALLVAAGAAAYAADISDTQAPVGGQCLAGAPVVLTSTSDGALRVEVTKLMDEAVAVAESPEWVASPRPVFLWASEAKVACGKAYGYLRSGYQDAEYLYKCECFHSRMISYMH
ncbi:hypothetical protein IZ6_09750 [Terrihabitans soli]|uniref:UrcA family protein n=1 Tax=Terrihabitans soli TaxID=708113 RepID=A0A6S6QTI9_9HYPH|nr:hypothetical protein [Terrihabitans soli]BCJ90240.1 hypothetical protein IZ6_09750 [Terrihabitans soli]